MGATSARLAVVPVVLVVQDTTEQDCTAHPATRGLGPLAHPAHRGLLVHTPMDLTPERVLLGLLPSKSGPATQRPSACGPPANDTLFGNRGATVASQHD